MSVLSPPQFESRPSDDFYLEELLSPIDPDRFLAEHWEQKELFVERDQPDYYGGLFTLDDVDKALHVARSCPDKTLILAPPQGSGQKRRQVQAAEVEADQVYQAFCDGYTVRIGGVDRFWPPLAQLRAGLVERLSVDVSVNLYMTPPSSQGCVAHFDNLDVFVVQLHGSKRWYLGDPSFELPGMGVQNVASELPRQTLPNDSPQLDRDVLIRAGDLLYLPRGYYHRPVAEEETSLHLTVGLYPVSWVDFVARALEYVALDHLPLRKGLPPGFARDGADREEMRETFAEILQAVAEKAPFDDTLGNIIRARRHAEDYPSDGHFAALDRLDSVTPDTVLERRRGMTCTVERRGDVVVVRFASNFVKGPPALEGVFEHVRDHRRFRVSELPPPLSDRSKATICRRLIREGLLRFADR